MPSLKMGEGVFRILSHVFVNSLCFCFLLFVLMTSIGKVSDTNDTLHQYQHHDTL